MGAMAFNIAPRTERHCVVPLWPVPDQRPWDDAVYYEGRMRRTRMAEICWRLDNAEVVPAMLWIDNLRLCS